MRKQSEEVVLEVWEKIEAIIILISFVIWSIGWLTTYIALKAILFYMKEKKYALPSRAELKKWCKYAARHTFGILQ